MINPAGQELFFFCVWEGGWGLVEMAFWLAHANFNLPERQAAKLNFFAPYSVICSVCLPILALFTSFSGHRPAQRECARTGLRSHARCHPYPTPQPVKVGHTTGAYDPYSFRIVMWVLLHPIRTNQWKCCEMGPTVFRPHPRRLESLTICRCYYKGSTFFSVIRPWVLVRPGFEPATSRSADWCSPNRANQMVVLLITLSPFLSSKAPIL